MKKITTLWLFVAAVVIVPLSVFAVVKWYEQYVEDLPVLGPENHRIGRFQFVDQHGNTINEDTWKNKVVVTNFFFTHCISVCPKMMYQLKRVQAYGDKNLVINSFSVDPERDSTGQLKIYSARLGAGNNWSLLTGDKKELYRFARKELLISATDGDGGPDDFIHSDNLVLIDKQKRIRGFYRGTDKDDVDRLIQDIKKLSNKRN